MAEEQTAQPESGGETTTEQQQTAAQGAGSKEAVLADLSGERRARKAAEKKAADLEARLGKIEADSKSDQDKALDAARKEADQAARVEERARANRRILTAEIKAAAGGRLQKPEDAVALLDLDEFEVDDDGEVSAEAISKALDSLLQERPYLAGQRTPAPDPAQGASGGTALNGDPLLKDLKTHLGIR